MTRRQMRIGAICVDQKSGKPLIVLHDPEGKLIMPIWVGAPEVRAITMAENNGEEIKKSRPSTYELLLSALSAMNVQVKEVSIEANSESVFQAWINLEGEHLNSESEFARIEARPADAVVVASLSGAPLFVTSDLFDDAIVQIEKPISEEENAQFKNFLQDIKPSDFEKWFEAQNNSEKTEEG